MYSLKKTVDEAASFIQGKMNLVAVKTGVILGSGLGNMVHQIGNAQAIETVGIPHWPKSTVTGHSGRLVYGRLGMVPVIVMQGRVHYYEGYTMEQVTFPVRVLGKLGIQYLIVTNAAGALNPDFKPGDFMLITDQINLMGTNPLIGYHDPESPDRFPDMSTAYNPELQKLALRAAGKLSIQIRQGVLAVTTGPSYETAAEARMLRILGGDAVCMSTVPEVIVAVQMGLHVLGLSCITNLATGLSETPLNHGDVQKAAGQVQDRFASLICGILEEMRVS